MPTSIGLTEPWDSEAKHVPEGPIDWRIVRPHRWSWKRDSTTTTDGAEVIAWSLDHWQFGGLHGTIASETDWDELAEWIDETYDEIIPTLKEMAEQHPDAMWFVG